MKEILAQDANNVTSHPHRASNGSELVNGYADTITDAVLKGALDARHRSILEGESAISPEAIEARGYYSTEDKQVLRVLGFAPSQCLPPALIIPLFNPLGERVGQIIKPNVPRNDTRNGKAIKYEIPKGAALTLDIAPLTAHLVSDISTPLIITEGAKKADSAASRGLLAMNLNGVYGFESKGQPLPEWDDVPLKNRVVYIAYDSDVNEKRGVDMAMRKLQAFLRSRGAVVKIIYLPTGPNGEKTGLDDFFVRGGTVEQLFTFARDIDALEESKRKQREHEKAEKKLRLESQAKAAGVPMIETGGRQDSEKIADLASAIEAVNVKSPRLFRGFSGLVRITTDPTGSVGIKTATRANIQDLAAKSAVWVRTGEREGIVDVSAPRDLCEMYGASEDNWRGVPYLEGTANAPFFAADGTLCDKPGYWQSAKIWLALAYGFKVGDTSPNPENIARARQIILEEILGEVAFADQASRAHAVAQMILPFVRQLIDGPTPLHLWNAPLRGSGKSYSAELCIWPFALPTPTAEKGNSEEWRKSLFCKLATGPSHVYLDNIKGSLNSSTLDAMITCQSGYFEERLTGTGENMVVKTSVVWVATANNASLTEDAGSRSIVIQIDPNLENPEDREFKKDPAKYIRENRAEVCGAIITLVRAWLENDRPAYIGTKRFRFPQWLTVMGGILQNAGIDGILENLEEQRAHIGANSGTEWHEFTEIWWATFGNELKTANELLPLAEKVPDMAAQFGDADTAGKQRKLGQYLAKNRDRVFGSLKIKSGPKVNRKVTFRLEHNERSVPMTQVTEVTEVPPPLRESVKSKTIDYLDTNDKNNTLSRQIGIASVTSVTSARKEAF